MGWPVQVGAQLGLPLAGGGGDALIVCHQCLGREILRLFVNAGCARRLIFTQSYSSSFIGDDLGGCVDADAVESVDQVDAVIQRDFVEVDDVP